jgi:predicted nucleic acid-binding protein
VRSSGSLVDTSVWIDFFKGVPPVQALLEKLIAEDKVFSAGPILFELLQGVRSPEERKQVKEAFMATHYLEIKHDDWEGAASLASDLRARGITIPITDILISHLAKSNHLEVLSFDLHFDQVPGLRRRKPGD